MPIHLPSHIWRSQFFVRIGNIKISKILAARVDGNCRNAYDHAYQSEMIN
jgi:hypothetical protein